MNKEITENTENTGNTRIVFDEKKKIKKIIFDEVRIQATTMVSFLQAIEEMKKNHGCEIVVLSFKIDD